MIILDVIDKLLLDIDFMLHEDKMKILNKEMARAERRYKGLTKEVKRFDMSMMSLGFGLLFTGMAIKQFTDRAIKGLQTNFMTLADEQSAGVKRIMEMQAAMNFLKFVITDLFVQSEFFGTLVEHFVAMAIWLADIAERNPALVEMAGAFLLISSIIGAIMMPLGQIALALFAIQTVGLPAIMLVLTVLYILLIVVTAIVAIVMIWNSNMSTTEKILWTVVVVVLAIIAATLILGFTLSLPFIVAAIAIGVVIAAFIAMSNHLGSVGDAFLAFGVFILWILALIADGIILLLLAPINMVINAINAAILASNQFLGTNFSTIGTIEFSVAKNVDKLRDDILLRAEERKSGSTNEQISSGPSVFELSQKSIDDLGWSMWQHAPMNGSPSQ